MSPTKSATKATKAPAAPAAPFDAADALLQAFATNDRITQYLLVELPPAAWTAAPPGGKGRTIAAIVAHMHNVRVMWLKTIAGAAVPAQLDRHTVTPAQAADALAESRAALADVLAAALAGDGRVKGFKPDAVGFFGYLVAHDAHHRGQIAMLARQSGHPLAQAAMFGMWEWGSRGRG
ncbi:MAG: DinB family protein [Gemmatirosa sp.]